MAEPIRNYTPRRDAREELRRKVEAAPVDHAEAVLSAYKLLQQASESGVLDVLRGAIGAGGTLIGEASQFANTPEGTRALRNLLALARVAGELDPTLLDAVADALAASRRQETGPRSPSMLGALRRIAGPNGRRSLARLAGFLDSFGAELGGAQREPAQDRASQRLPSMASGAAVPVVFSVAAIILVGLWLRRRTSSPE